MVRDIKIPNSRKFVRSWEREKPPVDRPGRAYSARRGVFNGGGVSVYNMLPRNFIPK